MINFEDLDPVEVNLKEFAEKCGLELISGDENDTVTFDSVLINRPGLYLAGFKEYFGHFRIQLIGNAEHFYLESLSQEERKELFNILGDEIVAEIISYVENIDEVINDFKPEHDADIIEKMDADDAIDVLSELEDDERQRIINLLRVMIREIIYYMIRYLLGLLVIEMYYIRELMIE